MDSTGQRLIEDWSAIQSKIDTYSWAKSIYESMKTKTDSWIAGYADEPTRIAGWVHNYICEDCAVHLIFDPAVPGSHRCSQCGKPRRDAVANEAWCAAYRSHACLEVFHAAVLYNLTGHIEYLNYIRKVLDFFSTHLEALEVRTPEGFEGIFAGINLADAIGICRLITGMELVKEQLSVSELTRYKERFFFPMAEFLDRKAGGTPNISCWMKSALGMIGLFFHEPKWCQLAADGYEGIKEQLTTGLLPEGFWYESSFHYHFYCAEGLTYYAAFCKLYDYDFSQFTEAIRSMYRYPTKYEFPNGLFPSPNDGWPFRTYKHYAHQYEWIQHMFDEPVFRYALSHCYDGEMIGSLPRLLFGTDWAAERHAYEQQHGVSLEPDRVSRVDPDIHYTMLQNREASIFFKYGFVISGHSHADVMNFELYLKDEIISRDISNSGYSSDVFKQWQRKSIAHNTVIVDRTNQPHRPPGVMLEFDAERNRCVAEARNVYPGHHYRRSLSLTEASLEDVFTCDSEDGMMHTYDWLFHCSGELKHDLPMVPVPPPGDADGYHLMQNVQSCEVHGDWSITWELESKSITLAMVGEPGTTVYIFRGYEHRTDFLRWGVMVRRRGTNARFKAAYRFG